MTASSARVASWTSRGATAEAALLLFCLRPLRWAPSSIAMRVVRRATEPKEESARKNASLSAAGAVLEHVAQAVATAARLVAGASCLEQAMAGFVMLRRRGVGAVVRLGVAKAGERRLHAHAWLDCGGRRIVGGDGSTDFTPLRRGA
jgi:hypothetical protein